MAKYGYLFLTKNLSTRDEDLTWMKAFGCDTIIEEDGAQEKYRPKWRRMLTRRPRIAMECHRPGSVSHTR